MRYIHFILALFVFLGCSARDMKPYSQTKPPLDLFDYFEGSTKGWGIVQNRSGGLTRQFVVTIQGTFDKQGNLVMAEDFVWSDGELSSRTWTISRSGDHAYSGTAADISGTASGSVSGSVLNWRYHMNIEAGGRSWKIFFDDWMFLQENGVLINKTRMSKFGLHVGDVTIVFQKT